MYYILFIIIFIVTFALIFYKLKNRNTYTKKFKDLKDEVNQEICSIILDMESYKNINNSIEYIMELDNILYFKFKDNILFKNYSDDKIKYTISKMKSEYIYTIIDINIEKSKNTMYINQNKEDSNSIQLDEYKINIPNSKNNSNLIDISKNIDSIFEK